jgi:hypothetical protein
MRFAPDATTISGTMVVSPGESGVHFVQLQIVTVSCQVGLVLWVRRQGCCYAAAIHGIQVFCKGVQELHHGGGLR